MSPEYLITFVTLAAITWSIGASCALVRASRSNRLSVLANLSCSLLVTVGALWLDAQLSTGRNALVNLLNVLRGSDPRQLCVAGMGACFGFVPALWAWQRSGSTERTNLRTVLLDIGAVVCVLGVFTAAGLLSLYDQLKPYLVHRSLGNIAADPFRIRVPEGFTCEEWSECQCHPVQITVGADGSVFAAAYHGFAYQTGVVVQFQEHPDTGNVSETIIARHLNRPNGIAFHEGELYVSRSGQHAKAVHGEIQHVDTGAVTLLRDLDGDGMMDYYHDVVTGLPGAQGPDELHQNNGIAFSADGYLFITSGAHSNRAPPSSKLEGAILRCRPNGEQLMVFAQGFRNPFDVVIGTDGELFCTDNDATGQGNGDEFNHVIQSGHYGFPYADGRASHPEGTVAPLAVVRPSSVEGLAYTDSSDLPEQYRNCFYTVSFDNGEIWQIRVTGSPGDYKAEKQLFARVPRSVDLTISTDGTFYVSSFDLQKIYRIRYRGPSS